MPRTGSKKKTLLSYCGQNEKTRKRFVKVKLEKAKARVRLGWFYRGVLNSKVVLKMCIWRIKKLFEEKKI